MLLVQHHLLPAIQAFTREEITVKTNTWIDTNFHVLTKVNFDRAIEQLANLQVPLGVGGDVQSIIKLQSGVCYRASKIESANLIVDYAWENVFKYSRAGVG